MEFKEFLKSHTYALTGGIASGKSTVGQILKQMGFLVIDADQLTKELHQQMTTKQKIYELLKDEFRDPAELLKIKQNQTIEKDQLRKLIFSNEGARKKLEGLLHPMIENNLREYLLNKNLLNSPQTVFYEASLIIENGSWDRFKEVWLVYCPENIQLQRLMQRSSMNQDSAKQIINSQWSIERKKPYCQLQINTHVTLEELENKVRELLKTKRLLT